MADKCQYCGGDVHNSPLVICDAKPAHPLPYKTLPINVRVRIETEPLKLITYKMKKEPQFKDLKFSSKKLLTAWIQKVGYAAIYLKSFGQDMQKIYVHKSGEILNTDFNQEIYIGKFINMEKLAFDRCLEIWNNDTECYETYGKLIPEEIIY
jgi:hypothetical protein